LTPPAPARNLRALSSPAKSHESPAGLFYAAGAFLLWGAFPVYWKQMQGVSAFELIAHRIVWSLFFLLVVQAWRHRYGAMLAAFTSWRSFGLNLLSSLLLTANWTIYVWAVNRGNVIESSLGYFLVPIANVAIGSLLLHEKLRPLQWLAIAGATGGVGLLLLGVGHVPWIALSIAVTWAGYGFLKKQSPLGPIAGLTIETFVLFPFAAAALLWWHHTGEGALGRVDARTHAFILCAGIVTAVPLLLFASGAQRLRLTTLGLFQYVSPTVQFLLGYFLYREPFSQSQFAAYAMIWCGLILYSADGFWSQRKRLFG
jgi:chloramphenicol-sensitive protein RarD